MMGPFFQGAGIGAGLIIAIGGQNAFVLSQGIRGRYPILIPLICWICDIVLILAGTAGLGRLVAQSSRGMRLAAWGGALFLVVYGFRSLQSAIVGGQLEGDAAAVSSLQSAVLTTLAVTLLNPHVYIDTVLLLGSLSGQYADAGRYFFAAGAIFSSFAWFFALSLGARFLAPCFRRPMAWRVLDSTVCLTMWSIAVSLTYRDICCAFALIAQT